MKFLLRMKIKGVFIRTFVLLLLVSLSERGIASPRHALSKMNSSLSSVLAKVKGRAQQAATGTLLVCSTVGLLSCSPIHTYERPVQKDSSSTEIRQLGRNTFGGKYAIDRSGEIIGFDRTTQHAAQKEIDKVTELAQSFHDKATEVRRTRAYNAAKWRLRFSELRYLHDRLRSWHATYADHPKEHGFDPSFMASLGAAIEGKTQMLEETQAEYGVEHGGVLLEGFLDFGWVFRKRDAWPPQFGFSKDDVVYGLSGLDVAKFNLLKSSRLRASDYQGVRVLVHYHDAEGKSHIGEVFAQLESLPPLLKMTSVFAEQQEQVIAVDQISGVFIADNPIYPAHKLAGRYIEFPADSIVEVLQGNGELIGQVDTTKWFGAADMMFSDDHVLARILSHPIEGSDDFKQLETPIHVLLEYKPTVKLRFDWDKIVEEAENHSLPKKY